jgi:hypothetical protein
MQQNYLYFKQKRVDLISKAKYLKARSKKTKKNKSYGMSFKTKRKYLEKSKKLRSYRLVDRKITKNSNQ